MRLDLLVTFSFYYRVKKRSIEGVLGTRILKHLRNIKFRTFIYSFEIYLLQNNIDTELNMLQKKIFN